MGHHHLLLILQIVAMIRLINPKLKNLSYPSQSNLPGSALIRIYFLKLTNFLTSFKTLDIYWQTDQIKVLSVLLGRPSSLGRSCSTSALLFSSSRATTTGFSAKMVYRKIHWRSRKSKENFVFILATKFVMKATGQY